MSFIDTFLGYHQIKMHPNNDEKIMFIIKDDVYCYNVMPFWLKNIDSSYQILLDVIFESKKKRIKIFNYILVNY